MTNEEVKAILSGIEPAVSFDETGEWINILVDASAWKDIALLLRKKHEFDYLFCVTCIDWKTHMTMVYHLSSTLHRFTIVIKANLVRDNAQIATVSDIWRTAEFHEREVYELFGVQFIGHPDLRRLILTDDFEGFPLRKDFEDPVNMIRL
ncbi:NADH-quinone oxidoreductase subunit C [Segetibacter sp. 3557_3]|uniref:NADH-quinone oxidoreductase subunit C n=1 Tax=Segetibacter sp. 3557_3 TaxID=2547429 RepID=UPI001058C19C|nr:NADH-quinone oxidoreductase subunit C [Segetibacter sp. 3557_3]TDH29267.1 NADH-quinone oxidoreductase subunit C [Segetibacter sp. 3557_3]